MKQDIFVWQVSPQFWNTDSSPRLSGLWILLLGLGKGGRATYNLIGFPIQHAKTHTSATTRLSQQSLPEQKAGSCFNAFKTKHIIFCILPWADLGIGLLKNNNSWRPQIQNLKFCKLSVLIAIQSRTRSNYKRHDFWGLRPSLLDQTFNNRKKFILLFTTERVLRAVMMNARASTFPGKNSQQSNALLTHWKHDSSCRCEIRIRQQTRARHLYSRLPVLHSLCPPPRCTASCWRKHTDKVQRAAAALTGNNRRW